MSGRWTRRHILVGKTRNVQDNLIGKCERSSLLWSPMLREEDIIKFGK